VNLPVTENRYRRLLETAGEINVTLDENNGLTLIVEDNGVGLKDNFDITKNKGFWLELVILMVIL
jgi:two-component sensor histidine kinase